MSGHLVDGEDGAHEGAGEVVPAVDDEDAELGVGGDGFAQIGDGRRGADQALAIPLAVDVVGERVVAGVGLPADDAGDEVDHGGGGGGDDAGEDRVVRLLVAASRGRDRGR